MRRLPVYLLVDTSESMVGTAIESVQSGLGVMMRALRKSPYALEMGAVSIITFDRVAKKVAPLTEVYSFQIPTLEVAPGTALGAGLRMLDQAMSTELVKNTPEQKGDYKPLVFILTDGQPTDEWKSAADQLKRNHKSTILYAIGCGDDVDFSVLRDLTTECYSMSQMDTETFSKLFTCISSNIQSASGSIGAGKGEDGVQNLAEWSGPSLEKVEKVEKRGSSKKRQVLISVLCQQHKKPYLLRYRLNDNAEYECVAAHKLNRLFSKEEAGSLESVPSSELQGCSPCPYCGNISCVYCACGIMGCWNPQNSLFKCPACGYNGKVGFGSFDINQSAG